MGIVNWRQVALDRNGYRDHLGRRLSFLESTATKEEEEEEEEERKKEKEEERME